MVTTEMHFDPPAVHPADYVFEHPWRSQAGVREFQQARRGVAAFRPDIAVSETMRDPRFPALIPSGLPVLLTTHDAQPHDHAHRPPTLRRLSGSYLVRRCVAEVAFSEHVAMLLRRTRGHPVVCIPLTSELPDTLTPEFVYAEGRRDFIVAGRLSPYKNLPVILEGYARHRAGSGYRGDRLVLLGDGDPGCVVPAWVEWRRRRFRFEELANVLATAKASICLYSAGSQSGVQVAGMQCGVQTLVSTVGGLASYLPPGEGPLDPTDAVALASRLDELANPSAAAFGGRRNQQHYLSHFSLDVTTGRWVEALQQFAK